MTGILNFDILRWLMGEEQKSGDRRGSQPRGRQRLAPLGEGARRVPFVGHVTMKQGAYSARARSGDLSEGGAFICTSDPPGVGCEVLLTIRLDDTLMLMTPAQVRWVGIDDRYRPTGCGVSFEPLSDETRQAVRRVLDAAEAREAERLAAEAERARRTTRARGFLSSLAG